MAFVSSPVQYPPSSSPPQQLDSLKRPAPPSENAPKAKKRLFGKSIHEPLLPVDPNGSRVTDEAQPPRQIHARETLKPSRNEQTLPAGTSLQNGAGVTHWKEPPSAPGLSKVQEEVAEINGTVVRTANGRRFVLQNRVAKQSLSYEQTIAQRSTTETGRATKSYYGVDIHQLLEEAKEINNKQREERERPAPPVEISVEPVKQKKRDRMMWAEKYRARKFTDLVGDERTHRSVLRWLKGWDSIVFPGAGKPTVKGKALEDDDRAKRKILLLTGPPGLGKTTLAHVCAKQAGYEVVEINASDDRSRKVVDDRIRNSVATENVRGTNKKIGEKTVRKSGKPVCVVVDEVDGVVTGSGGSGDGGFMKALIDLVLLDQRNCNHSTTSTARKGQKDKFKLLRPIILICNDVYHPSLRPLRSSNLAEIIHVRKPPLDKVVARLKHVFDKESVPADTDGIRRLCEATWGISNRQEDRHGSNTGDGDMRAVLVVGEWAAGKLRASAQISTATLRLSRQWIEKNMLTDLSSSGSNSSSRGLGRGGTKEASDRVFLDNAGFPKSATAPSAKGSMTITSGPSSATEATRGRALELLRSVVDTAGDSDRIVTDVYTSYPTRSFHDDTFLSKPNAAAEWLSFHDTLSSKVHGASQSYELAPYLSTSVLAFHSLFASAQSSITRKSNFEQEENSGEAENHPFQGPRADFAAYEEQKETRAQLLSLQSSLTMSLARSFRSPEHLATDLVPYLDRMLNPAVSPILVGGAGSAKTGSVRRDVEKDMVKRSVQAMGAAGIGLEKMRVDDERQGSGGWVYRMEPPIDTLSVYQTSSQTSENTVPARFAVRQVMAQEHTKWIAEEEAKARQARFEAGRESSTYKGVARENKNTKKEEATDIKRSVVKKDFFGRIIKVDTTNDGPGSRRDRDAGKGKARTWVSYNEGFSNAVRKPIGLAELMAGL